jgi:hypothetical protein
MKSTLLLALVGSLFALSLATAPAHAQATRTWISGVGDDANPCSRTAPCKTFAGAISKTSPGGEIDALDPGGFGGVTITKSITFDGGGGQVASILVSGTPGITVNATGGIVILRNMRLNGIVQSGSAGTIGVNVVLASRVIIEKCDIFGFSGFGVSATPSTGPLYLQIQETTLNNNGGGLGTKPTGGAVVNAEIVSSHIDANGGGVKFDGTGGGATNAAITNSSISLNTNNAMNAQSGGSGGNVNVDMMSDVLANNGGTAVIANQASGGATVVTVGNTVLSYNGTAWSNSSATLLSFKNNQVTGPTGTPPTMASFQ